MKEKTVALQIKLLWVGVGILGIFCGYHELLIK